MESKEEKQETKYPNAPEVQKTPVGNAAGASPSKSSPPPADDDRGIEMLGKLVSAPSIAIVLSLFALIIGISIISDRTVKDKLNRLDSQISKLENRLMSGESRDTHVEDEVRTIKSRVEDINGRLQNAEGWVVDDMKKRTEAEIYKLLLGVKEASRLADPQTREKMERIENILDEIVSPPAEEVSPRVIEPSVEEETQDAGGVEEEEPVGQPVAAGVVNEEEATPESHQQAPVEEKASERGEEGEGTVKPSAELLSPVEAEEEESVGETPVEDAFEEKEEEAGAGNSAPSGDVEEKSIEKEMPGKE